MLKYLLISTIALAGLASFAAAQDKTLILVRHAEKTAAEPNNADPSLSTEGEARAARFMKVARRYRPGEIFSTAFKRTQQTAEQIAKFRGKAVQTYDSSKQAELVDTILKSKTKRFVIVGHSNTIPALANLLAKKEIFRNLVENEFGVYYVVKIKKGEFRQIEVHPY